MRKLTKNDKLYLWFTVPSASLLFVFMFILVPIFWGANEIPRQDPPGWLTVIVIVSAIITICGHIFGVRKGVIIHSMENKGNK